MLLGNETDKTANLLQLTEHNNNELTILNKDTTAVELTEMTEQQTEPKDTLL